MQRNTGSLIGLFSCRNCKKRRHATDSKNNTSDLVANRHKSAPIQMGRLDLNENESSSADDSRVRQRHQSYERSQSEEGSDVKANSKSPFHRLGVSRMSMSNYELSADHSRHSILKTPECTPISDEHKRHGSICAGEKRARFKEAVEVIVHDTCGNAISKDRVKLKPGKDCVVPPPGEYNKKRLFAYDHRVSRTVARDRAVFSLRSMRIETRPDGRKYLRLVVVLLDEAVTERTIHVCTANGGSRIVVGAYRPEPLGDGTNYLRQYIDRFQLPHPVDAFSIQGELDYSGNLVITAPLFDYDNEPTDNSV